MNSYFGWKHTVPIGTKWQQEIQSKRQHKDRTQLSWFCFLWLIYVLRNLLKGDRLSSCLLSVVVLLFAEWLRCALWCVLWCDVWFTFWPTSSPHFADEQLTHVIGLQVAQLCKDWGINTTGATPLNVNTHVPKVRGIQTPWVSQNEFSCLTLHVLLEGKGLLQLFWR